jgi:uncharacterized membrane protein
MTRDWEGILERWTAAGLLDTDAAARIRSWENERSRSQGLGWPIRIALAFGAILLVAGVFLFVSAHWDQLSPAGRMSMVVATLAALHIGGAVSARRFVALSVALHAAGSVALGGAIGLAGQIFNLSEHWPSAVLMWLAGCALAWLLLRHWTQGVLCAVLFPWWLAGEWDVRMVPGDSRSLLPVWLGICALSFVYLSARRSPEDAPMRKALGWLGGLALLPACAIVATQGAWGRGEEAWGSAAYAMAWAVALLVPLAVAVLLDRGRAVWSAAAIAWTVLLAMIGSGAYSQVAYSQVAVYGWCLIGAAGLAAWGIRDGRAERINLGVAGLAVTVLTFYFSSVMDKLGRSASLIAIGLLFLGGGWLLERMRRRLLANMSTEAL